MSPSFHLPSGWAFQKRLVRQLHNRVAYQQAKSNLARRRGSMSYSAFNSTRCSNTMLEPHVVERLPTCHVTILPRLQALANKTRVEELLDWSDAWLDNGKYDEAIAGYTEVMRLWPKCVEVHHYRGVAYQAKGEPALAKLDFDKAASLGFRPSSHNGGNSAEKVRCKGYFWQALREELATCWTLLLRILG